MHNINSKYFKVNEKDYLNIKNKMERMERIKDTETKKFRPSKVSCFFIFVFWTFNICILVLYYKKGIFEGVYA